ncbi:hypothetical protein [Paenibacillus sp. FSL R5-0519]|uniref:hypothetical protein n=1 Tax=unclassified Paenibacillus TaxID=185978 RepID=UPI0030DDDD9A
MDAHQCNGLKDAVFVQGIAHDIDKDGSDEWSMNIENEYFETISFCPFCGTKLE